MIYFDLQLYYLIISFSFQAPFMNPSLVSIDVMSFLMYVMLLITTNTIYVLSLYVFISIWYKMILFKSI